MSDLAQPFQITLTGLEKHLVVLEEIELVTTEKIGRSRYWRLGPRRLDDAALWIAIYRLLAEGWLRELGSASCGACPVGNGDRGTTFEL